MYKEKVDSTGVPGQECDITSPPSPALMGRNVVPSRPPAHAGLQRVVEGRVGSGALWRIARRCHVLQTLPDVCLSHRSIGAEAFSLYPPAPQAYLDTVRSAWQELGVADQQLAHVCGMKTIHVFIRADRQQHLPTYMACWRIKQAPPYADPSPWAAPVRVIFAKGGLESRA